MTQNRELQHPDLNRRIFGNKFRGGWVDLKDPGLYS
jgi:hypothetical protein